MVTVAIKRKLETALKNSLQQALIEMESVEKKVSQKKLCVI